jgi:hypothetical protein
MKLSELLIDPTNIILEKINKKSSKNKELDDFLKAEEEQQELEKLLQNTEKKFDGAKSGRYTK